MRKLGICSMASRGTLMKLSFVTAAPAASTSLRVCVKSTITSSRLEFGSFGSVSLKPTSLMKLTDASEDATCASTAACNGPPIIFLKSMLLSSEIRLTDGASAGGAPARTARTSWRPTASTWAALTAPPEAEETSAADLPAASRLPFFAAEVVAFLVAIMIPSRIGLTNLA